MVGLAQNLTACDHPTVYRIPSENSRNDDLAALYRPAYQIDEVDLALYHMLRIKVINRRRGVRSRKTALGSSGRVYQLSLVVGLTRPVVINDLIDTHVFHQDGPGCLAKCRHAYRKPQRRSRGRPATVDHQHRSGAELDSAQNETPVFVYVSPYGVRSAVYIANHFIEGGQR